MKHQFITLSKFLIQDFQNRKSRKPSYSIRSYGRYLGLPRTTVHNLLLGNAHGSKAAIETVSSKLGLTRSETLYLEKVAELRKARATSRREKLRTEIMSLDTRFNLLSESDFERIGYWDYFRVMELIKTRPNAVDASWIARRLSVPRRTVLAALHELQRQKVIEMLPDGQLRVMRDFITLPSGKRLDSARAFHSKVIKKAGTALRSQTEGKERNISSMVLKFRKSDLPNVDEFIRRFRREFSAEFESGEGHDSVYTLGVQFFRSDRD